MKIASIAKGSHRIHPGHDFPSAEGNKEPTNVLFHSGSHDSLRNCDAKSLHTMMQYPSLPRTFPRKPLCDTEAWKTTYVQVQKCLKRYDFRAATHLNFLWNALHPCHELYLSSSQPNNLLKKKKQRN